jgi:cobalt-zinc-cadmium efflux system protein
MNDRHHHHNPHHHFNANRAFAIGVTLNIAFVAAEATFGVVADSLALIADAGHNLSDVLGLLLAWGANALGHRQPSQRRTYGWRSTSIMAALINALMLLFVVGGISWEAVGRFSEPTPVAGQTVIIVAFCGVLVNTLTAFLFISGRKEDLNIRGAYLHMAADAAVSAGVVAAGLLMWWTGWLWLDPVVSLIIAAIIFAGTWGLLRESLDLILHAVPSGIDPEAIEAYLASLPGITAVHDLHVWAMSTTANALTAHLVKPDPAGDDQMILTATGELRHQYGIEHVTLQLERRADLFDCGSNCRPNGGEHPIAD